MVTVKEGLVLVVELLKRDAAEAVDEATDAVLRTTPKHYATEGRPALRRRLAEIYDLLVRCVERNDAAPMIEHARRIAAERFEGGFDLHEVQSAINVIEEAVWKRILASMPPEELGRALGLVSTVLGMAKDTLARSYVSLATRSHAPSLDLKRLFKGTDGV